VTPVVPPAESPVSAAWSLQAGQSVVGESSPWAELPAAVASAQLAAIRAAPAARSLQVAQSLAGESSALEVSALEALVAQQVELASVT